MQEAQDLLFFKLNSKERYSLPLCLVHRLEEFKAEDVESSGAQRIIKYRDSILPLISLNEYLKLPILTEPKEKISVIVVQKKNRNFGIEVNEVIDILNVGSSIQDPVKEVDGILGSVIYETGISTVIDVLGILDKTMGESSKTEELPATSRNGKVIAKFEPKNIHVLFAEDTVFFVKQVKKVLEQAGYRITHAPDGLAAWNALSTAPDGEYQILLSDIEMPHMTGFELAEKVRGDARFEKLPVIALTTRFRDADRELGTKMGFTRYLEKLRSDELLDTMKTVLTQS
jgi:two-component system chemotaxis sensor kinase CheA